MEGSEAVADSKRNRKKGGINSLFNLYYCPICNKDFVVLNIGQYVYKKNDGKNLRYFCSYGCYRRFSKEYEEKKKLNNRRGRYKQIENKKRKEAEKLDLSECQKDKVPKSENGD